MRRLISSTLLLVLCTSDMPAQPIVGSQPTDQTVNSGGNATFSVTATDVTPLTYQWLFNGTNLPNNIITTVAGSGNSNGNFGDGGVATNASLNGPVGLAVDGSGNVYIADTGNNFIRRLGTNGVITRIAGNGTAAYSGDGGAATGAALNRPYGVAIDASGKVFIADQNNGLIRQVNTNGLINSVAGTGLVYPTGVAVDAIGNIFIAEQGRHCIRKVDTNGVITTIAGIRGNITSGYSGDGGQATNATLNYPTGVAVDSTGNLYIADYSNNAIRKVDTNGVISTVAGNGNFGYNGDGGQATNAWLSQPPGVWVDAGGNLFIADQLNKRIRKVTTNGIITTVAGSGESGAPTDGVPATSSRMRSPSGVVGDAAGNLFIAETGSHLIRKVSTNGIISTVAGSGSAVWTGDYGPAKVARLGLPAGIALDALGNFYVADRNFHRIRKVDANGRITTVVGSGAQGIPPNGISALQAPLNNPLGVALDPTGTLYVLDWGNRCVRKIRANGTIVAVAGTGTAGFSGDGGAATNATFNSPVGMVMDKTGNFFIADEGNHRIRKVDTNGTITTVAGNGVATFGGDGGAATNASLNAPSGLATDDIGNLFIADKGNNRIRKVDTSGIIRTVAGTNGSGFSAVEWLAITNRLSSPISVAVDYAGNLYISDNNRIRKIGTNGMIKTVAGNVDYTFSGDGGLATNASLYGPVGVAADLAGNIFIVDQNNFRIRKVVFADKPAFTVIAANTNNVGEYQVIVTSSSGSVTSSIARLFLSPQIQISAVTFGVASNTFGFNVTGISNQVVVVEASTSLAPSQWVPLQTNTFSTNAFYFSDPQWTNYPGRFYRLRSP